MSTNLGVRSAEGVLSTKGFFTPGVSLWVITFGPAQLTGTSGNDFEIYHGSIRGPGGSFLVFLDDNQYGVGDNGIINEYVPTRPMKVRPGQTITLNWSIGTGTKPKAWLYLQQSEIS